MLILDQLAAAGTIKLLELRLRARRTLDGGYSTEAIAVTAFLVALALLALGIWGDKLLEKIRGIML